MDIALYSANVCIWKTLITKELEEQRNGLFRNFAHKE